MNYSVVGLIRARLNIASNDTLPPLNTVDNVDVVIGAALDVLNAIQIESIDTDDVAAQLEEIGEDVFEFIFKDITLSRNAVEAPTTFVSATQIADRSTKLVAAIAHHMLDGMTIHISGPGITATATNLPENVLRFHPTIENSENERPESLNESVDPKGSSNKTGENQWSGNYTDEFEGSVRETDKVQGSIDDAGESQGSVKETDTSKSFENYLEAPVVILPSEALDMLAKEHALLVIVFIDMIIQPRNVTIDDYTSDTLDYIYLVASGTLSVTLFVNGKVYSIAPEITIPYFAREPILFNGRNYTVKDKICAFWNETANVTWSYSTNGVYKTKDEVVDSGAHRNIISCRSTHTTSFAVLLQLCSECSLKVSNTHQRILEMMTQAGCSISIVALVITIVVFSAFETLRSSDRYKIHINLAVSLLMAQLLFLTGVEQTQNKVVCKVIAMMLHYLFLAVFGWMLAEGINLYFKIVKVYGAEKNRLLLYIGIGWVCPIPIVTISAATRFNDYTSTSSCWLNSNSGLIWAFAGPAAFVILVNTVILVTVGRILWRSVNAVNANNDMTGIRVSLKGTVILTPLLGITWGFGFMAIGGATPVFQYLFVIFNSLQGLFVFIMYCLLNKEVRGLFKRILELHQLSTRNLTKVVPFDNTSIK